MTVVCFKCEFMPHALMLWRFVWHVSAILKSSLVTSLILIFWIIVLTLSTFSVIWILRRRINFRFQHHPTERIACRAQRPLPIPACCQVTTWRHYIGLLPLYLRKRHVVQLRNVNDKKTTDKIILTCLIFSSAVTSRLVLAHWGCVRFVTIYHRSWEIIYWGNCYFCSGSWLLWSSVAKQLCEIVVRIRFGDDSRANRRTPLPNKR